MSGTLITKDMTIAAILEAAPEAAGVLLDEGMPCIGCSLACLGTLEEGARARDLDPDRIVERIRRRIAAVQSTEEEAE